MEVKPSPNDIAEIIRKLELLWDQTRKILDLYPVAKLEAAADKIPHSLGRRAEIDRFLFGKTDYEKAREEIESTCRAKNSEWRRTVTPLVEELDKDFTCYRQYFSNRGFGYLAGLHFKTLEFLLGYAYPEKPSGHEENLRLDFVGVPTEKDVINGIIYDLKRIQRIAEIEAAGNTVKQSEDCTDIPIDIRRFNSGKGKAELELFVSNNYAACASRDGAIKLRKRLIDKLKSQVDNPENLITQEGFTVRTKEKFRFVKK